MEKEIWHLRNFYFIFTLNKFVMLLWKVIKLPYLSFVRKNIYFNINARYNFEGTLKL